MTKNIDTTNRQVDGAGINRISVMMPQPMTADEALVHAAWIVAMAGPDASFTFAEAYEAVCST